MMPSISLRRLFSAYTRAPSPPRQGLTGFSDRYARLQRERVSAFAEFKADVASGAYPEDQHLVTISDEEFASSLQHFERSDSITA